MTLPHIIRFPDMKDTKVMNLYSIGVRVHATAYVKAKDEAEALVKLKAWINEGGYGELAGEGISGLSYRNPALPAVSLSPAVTIWSEEIDEEQSVELAEEDVEYD